MFPIPATWLRARGPFGALMAEIGREGIKPHDLRGTTATHLLSGSFGHPWTIAEVAAHLGDTEATIRKHYAHVTASAQRAAADRLGNGWGTPPS